jgi:hypothetical protein
MPFQWIDAPTSSVCARRFADHLPKGYEEAVSW